MSHLKPVAGIPPGGHASLAAGEPGVLGHSIRQVEQFGLARLQGQRKDGWTLATVENIIEPVACKHVWLSFKIVWTPQRQQLCSTRQACVCSNEKVLLSNLLQIGKPELGTT